MPRTLGRISGPRSLRVAAFALLVAFASYPIAVVAGYLWFGSEHRVSYDREYEQAPPSTTSPAVVDALARQGFVDERGFTATLFDLIRRGRYTATPATVEQSTWLGLKKEQITDLEIGLGKDTVPLENHERPVASIVDRIVASGPVPLTEFRRELREDPSTNHADYESFKSASSSALKDQGLLDTVGKRFPIYLILGVIVMAALGAWLLPWALGSRLSFEAKSLMQVGFFAFGIIGRGRQCGVGRPNQAVGAPDAGGRPPERAMEGVSAIPGRLQPSPRSPGAFVGFVGGVSRLRDCARCCR